MVPAIFEEITKTVGKNFRVAKSEGALGRKIINRSRLEADRDRGESFSRGRWWERDQAELPCDSANTYVLVAGQMACDWHPRSATRPRAANAANSRRSLPRKSTHPHPHPHARPAHPASASTRWSFPSFVFRYFLQHILLFRCSTTGEIPHFYLLLKFSHAIPEIRVKKYRFLISPRYAWRLNVCTKCVCAK